jgi:hypothetical protein
MYKPEKYRRNPDVSWRLIEGQAVLVHNREGEIEVLNEVGSYLWEHAGEPLEELARNISRDFDVSEGAALRDAEAFYEELVASGALQLIDEA